MRRLDFDLDSNYSNLRPQNPISSAEIEEAQQELEGALTSDSPMIIGMTLKMHCENSAKEKFGSYDKTNPPTEVKEFLDKCNTGKLGANSTPITTPTEQRSKELKLKSEAQNKMALLGILALVGVLYVVSKKSL